MTKHRLGLALLASLALSAPAHALRCGSGIVSVGDTTLKLLSTCGKPTLTERVDEPAGPILDPYTGTWVYGAASVGAEVWTYNFGPQRFIQRITIRNGRVYRIDSQGYGF